MDKNSLGLDSLFRADEQAQVERSRSKARSSVTDLGGILSQEGADNLRPIVEAIYGQESGSGVNAVTSVNGARGGMQIIPATFNRFAKPGESIDNPDDNMRVGVRIIKNLADKFGNDPAKIATGYFSGEGNVNPGQGAAWKRDARDGNGKSVSGYVADVVKRVGGQAQSQPELPDLSKAPTWAQVTQDPGYAALSPEDKKQAKAAYFDYWIAPHAGDEQEAIRAKFFAQEDAKPAPNANANALTDAGNLLGIGVNSMTQNVRELVGRIPLVGESIVKGVDAADKFLTGRTSEEILKGNVQDAQARLSPEMQAAGQKKWWDSEAGTFGDAWKDPRSYASGVLQSLPEQALTMFPAMRLAKGVYASKVAAGVAPEAAAKAGAKAAAVAGGVSEGALAGAGSSIEVRDKIMAMPPEQLQNSEAMQSLMSEGLSFEQAKQQIANDSATQAFIASGVVTGAFGGFGDRALAKAFTSGLGKNALTRAGKGAVSEGLLEELPQEFGSAVAENAALRRADPSIGLTDDALNRGLGGAATGGLQGGVMTAFGRSEAPQATPAVSPDGRIEPPPAEVPPTVQSADAIVRELAAQAGIPESTVLPTAPQLEPAGAQATPDQDVLDFAALRLEQLRAKRDGTIETVMGQDGPVEQEMPGAGLLPDEQLELAALEQTQGDPLALRKLYGFDQAPTEPGLVAAQENQDVQIDQQTQVAGPAPSPDALVQDGQRSGPTTEQGSAVQAEAAPAVADDGGARRVGERPQEPVAPDLSQLADDELQARLDYITGQARNNNGWNAMLTAARREVDAEIARRKPVEATPPAAPAAPKTEKEANQAKDYSDKWFGTAQKAQDFIAKKRIGDTHEAVQAGPSRFEIKRKEQQQNVTQAPQAEQAEAQGPEQQQAAAADVTAKPKTEKEARAALFAELRSKLGELSDRAFDAGNGSEAGRIRGFTVGMSENDALLTREWVDKVVADREAIVRRLEIKSRPKTEKEARAKREEAAIERGTIGMKLAAGQVVLTSSGRKTTPFPKLDTSNNRKALNTVTRVNRWLIENALAEAQSRGDQFNERQFQSVNNLNPSQSDKDSAEEYLFGQQPAVVPSILKPLAPKSESKPADLPKRPAETNTSAEPVQKTGESEQVAQDFDAMFDEVLAEEVAKDAAGQQDELDAEMRAYERKAEQAAKPKTEKEARAQRTATESLASAAKNTAAGLDAAIDGLGKLFGGPGRLNSGLTFDEETYAKAKPLFQQAIANLKDASSDLKEAMRTVVRMVLDKFGAQAAQNMKPYVVRFIEETAGKVGEEPKQQPAAGKVDLSTPEGKFKVAQEIADFLIGDGSFKTIIEARKKISDMIGRPIESATELAKQADEAIETGVVLAGREIVAAGRKQGRSPQVIYDRLVGLYNRQPNLSVRSSTSVRDQAYSTPVPLAYLASELAGITYNSKVLEPTAGNGMLLVGAKLENSVANELNPKRAAMLDAMGFKSATENAATGTLAPAKSQDAVIANPPFGSTKDAQGNTIIYEVKPTYGTREVDHAIAFKALDTMKDDGRAVLIVGGVQSEAEEARREDYRGKSKRTFYFNLYNDYNVVDHFTVDGDLYSKQGASYPVDVIVIEGRGKSARDLPAADLPRIIRSYDELKEKLNGASGVESRADGGTDGVGGRNAQTGTGDGTGLGAGAGRPDNRTGTESQAGDAGAGVRGNGPANGGRPESSGERTGAGQSQSENAPQSGNAGAKPIPGEGKQQQPGSTGRNRPNRPADVGGSSVVAGERVESGLTDRRGEEQETETQVAYAPHSQASSVGTLVPKAMRDAIDASIKRIKDRVGDLDQYVADSLQMDAETLRANFSAEQVDALALAIDNAEAGKGFIIGDQTGIGKGRVVAAMIRYALVNGKTPIFVTEKPNLYSDMIRDLDDIGMTNDLALDTKKPRIFITNGGESIPYTLIRTKNGEVTETNLTLRAPKSGKALDDMMRDMATGNSLGEYRVIFTTYSQLQTVKGKMTERQRFVKQFGNGNYMIFDESHNAGGSGEQQARTKEQREAEKKGESTAAGRAAFVRQLVGNAFGTFFSSATYAKRPDVMDLYSSTNMSLAVDRPRDLADAIKNGGVPMQQVVATMLTKDGQYIRRERTFAGVSYDTVETKVDKQTAENMASAMRSILAFSRAKEAAVTAMQNDMDKQGAMLAAVGAESSSVQGANFGAIMHNLIDQMLLSLKAQDSVKHAIARLKAGEKVVMTVSNTMGSFLQTYAEDMGLNAGDPVALSFADLYGRYLEKQRVVRIKSPGGETKLHRLTDAELGPSLVAMFNRIKQQIADSGFGSAPISPIDYLHSELRKAGYKTDEITGRTITLNYENGTPTLASRSANIKQRVGAVRGFNNGDTDVLILNQAGATGLSLHASSKFKDKRKRHMIVVQAEKNIDTHMQMLGRVHRTGQVLAPSYSQMMADVPAEMRPAAVLLKKMASLNANTTASRKSAVTAEGVVDFMNDYGGQVVHEYLRDNLEVLEAIGGSKVIKLVDDPAEEASEDDIRKFTGYIPILPIAQQEEIYKDLIGRYNELLERENSLGTNKLEAKAMDLDAETVESQPITEQKESQSVFAAPAQMERVDVKRTVKPYSTAEVTDMVKERLGDQTAKAIADEAIKALAQRTDEYKKKIIGKLQAAESPDPIRIEATRNQIDMAYNIASTALATYRIGDTVSITSSDGQVLYGAITDISNSGRTANPAAGSDWKMQIALANGDAKSLTLSFSQLASRYKLAKEQNVNWYNAETQALEPTRVLDIFDKGATVRREKRWMVTGNILAGFASYPGQIISYTKKDGTVSQGVLMNRQFDFAKVQKSAPVRIKSGAAAGQFFGATGDNAAIGTPDGVLRISVRGDAYTVTVPSSKKEGGTYFLDTGLTNALGGDFYKNGSVMLARNVSESNMQRAVEYLIKQREEVLIALNNQDKAREMFAVKADSGIGPRQFNDLLGTPAPATIKVDGKDRPTRNSDGRLIHPTQEGVRNFWRWFGKSVLTNDDGLPVVMYHQTKGDFATFIPGGKNPLVSGPAVWMRQDPSKMMSGHNTGTRRAGEFQQGSLDMPLYAKLNNALGSTDANWKEVYGQFKEKGNSPWIMTPEFVAELKSKGYDGIMHFDKNGVLQEVAVFEAEQIKSATGNTGEFSPERASILNDISVSPSFAFATTPEAVRANALAKLKSLERKREAGKITEAEYRLGVQEVIGKIEQRNEAREDRRASTGRRRGADWIVAQLRRGVADDTIPRREADFAEWLLSQNPGLANDLGISMSGKSGSAAGNYNPVSRVATLFTSANLGSGTAVHEILHHSERMMPVEVQDGIMKEWQRAWDAAYKAGDDKLKAALNDMLAASLGDTKARERTVQAFNSGRLKYAEHYQLYSPSEFWTVNATRILSGRFNAKGSWVARAAQWFKEFVERAKAVFGLRSNAPVLKALEAVMRGEGEFLAGAKMMAERVSGASTSDGIVYNDIARNVQNNVIQFFGNRKDNIKTFGAYDKTLATQYHKALKDRDFGRVFNLSLDMQNAVSQVAIRPAELAPAILPRVDDVKSALKTVWKGKKASADLDAAAKAIFAGTLAGNNVMEGKVFTDDELRSQFKMTDAGIALYKQARAAIDSSLDELAASEAYAMAHGFIPKSLRARIVGNPQNARGVITGALSSQMRMLQAAIRTAQARGNEQQQSQLEASLQAYLATQQTVDKIFDTSEGLKAAGYAPLMRFGKYTVTVYAIDPTTGEVLRDANGDAITEFYGQYETKGEARAVRNQKEADYQGRDDIRVTTGVKSQTAHELYAGISPETLAVFADAIGAGEAMRQYYQLALTERSALKRRLERKGIAGFSEDMPRVLSNFITSNARFAAQRYYQRDLNNAIKFIPKEKGDVIDEAIALKKFINNPNDPAAPVSAALFAWFLGGSVASAAVNLTQPVLMTAPYLAQHGVGRATTAMAKAMPYALGKKQITDGDLRDALKQASQEGIVDAQEIFHLYSVGAQGVASGLTNALAKLPGVGGKIKAGSESARARINAFLTLWGSMFSLAEGFNRKLTFIAAWEVAKAKGEKDAYAFAVKAVNETQGIYNKVNRPNWARGPVGRTVLTFKQFSIAYVELLSRMWKRGGPEGKRAALMMLAMLMLASGEEGLPFSQDLDDLIDTVGQFFGFDTNMRRSKRRLAHEILGKTAGDLFLYGISSQLPLDFAGRLGLGNIAPGSGALKRSDQELIGRNVAEILGPAAGMATQIADAYDAYVEGNQKKALQNLAPKAVKDVMAGLEMADKGYATDAKGRKTTDVTQGEAAIKAVGFTPTTVAQLTRATMPIQQDVALQRRAETSILDEWVRGISDNDQAMIDKAMKRMDAWNKDNPDSPIVITASQIKARRRAMSLDKETRLLKAAPREMRGRVAEGLDAIE